MIPTRCVALPQRTHKDAKGNVRHGNFHTISFSFSASVPHVDIISCMNMDLSANDQGLV